ncbi:MAG: hypothetical protein LBU40_01895 [Methanobrevibacter sp.]|jgi:hypothetical protein|nr:hypothetical protein [Methanobrevibacter sp.]
MKSKESIFLNVNTVVRNILKFELNATYINYKGCCKFLSRKSEGTGNCLRFLINYSTGKDNSESSEVNDFKCSDCTVKVSKRFLHKHKGLNDKIINGIMDMYTFNGVEDLFTLSIRDFERVKGVSNVLATLIVNAIYAVKEDMNHLFTFFKEEGTGLGEQLLLETVKQEKRRLLLRSFGKNEPINGNLLNSCLNPLELNEPVATEEPEPEPAKNTDSGEWKKFFKI